MPAAKPARIKKLEGNPSKRKINKKEPIPVGIDKTAPRDLSLVAKKVWAVLVHSMPDGVYTGADIELLRAYCEACAMHRKVSAALKKVDLLVEGSTGQVRPNPLIKVQVEQARAIATLGARLGLDPIARQHIEVQSGEGGVADKFDGLIN